MVHHEKWKEHTTALPPLRIGDQVWIQNQTGPHPTKWDKTGVIVEVRQYHQYVIRVDGSGRITLRNRKFLRKYTPVCQPAAKRSILDDMACLPPTPQLEGSPGQNQAPPVVHSSQPPLVTTAGNSQSPQKTPTPATPSSPSKTDLGTLSPPMPSLTLPLEHIPCQTTAPPLLTEPPPQPSRPQRIKIPPAWQRSGDYIL